MVANCTTELNNIVSILQSSKAPWPPHARHIHADRREPGFCGQDGGGAREGPLDQQSVFQQAFDLLAAAKLSTDVKKELEEMRRRVETFLQQQSRNGKE